MIDNTFDNLLDELYKLTEMEQEHNLTLTESGRYEEIVGILQKNNVEIPFGYEV